MVKIYFLIALNKVQERKDERSGICDSSGGSNDDDGGGEKENGKEEKRKETVF